MWSQRYFYFAFGIASFAVCSLALDGTESIEYSTDAFKEKVPKKNHFVMFYAPWCEHCKRLAPSWNELSEKFGGKSGDSEVVVAQVDCTVETALCSDNDVTGYPTLKFFKKGESSGVKFRGSRDVSSLKAFIYEQIGKKEDSSEETDSEETSSKLFELTEENFDDHVKTGKHFVKFFAPWCGHCQKMAPAWNELAQTLDSALGVTIGKVDCTIHRSVCNEFEVKGYPTLLWIEDGVKTDKYQGARTLEDLKDFVYKRAESTEKQQTEKPAVEDSSPVLSLNGDNFQESISTGVNFVKFFAPWCGHCKRLAPTWDELALKFKENPNIHIAKVDCTLDESKDLCSSEEVNGFPTIFIYRDGEKISEYNGSRSLEDLYQFVVKHANEAKKDEL